MEPPTEKKSMTDRLNRYAFLISFSALFLSPVSALSDETNLLLRLDAQEKIINSQNQRIERLERALEDIVSTPEEMRRARSNPLNSNPSGGSPAPESETPSQGSSSIPTADSASATGAVEDPFAGQSAPKKGYNPEQSFFGPRPRFTSPTG